MAELCREMNVNRSGYYKWAARKGIYNRYEKDRKVLTEMLWAAHNKHRAYGYHRLAKMVREETGWLFSDNLAHELKPKSLTTTGVVPSWDKNTNGFVIWLEENGLRMLL